MEERVRFGGQVCLHAPSKMHNHTSTKLPTIQRIGEMTQLSKCLPHKNELGFDSQNPLLKKKIQTMWWYALVISELQKWTLGFLSQQTN